MTGLNCRIILRSLQHSRRSQNCGNWWSDVDKGKGAAYGSRTIQSTVLFRKLLPNHLYPINICQNILAPSAGGWLFASNSSTHISERRFGIVPWTCYVLKYRLTDFEIYWEVILAKAWHICYNGLVKPIRVSQINRLTFRTMCMKYNWILDYWQSYGVKLCGCFFV